MRNQLQSLHVDCDTDPVAEGSVDILVVEIMTRVTADLLQVEVEVCLQLLHVELEVAHLRQVVHFLNKEHGVVLRSCH